MGRKYYCIFSVSFLLIIAAFLSIKGSSSRKILDEHRIIKITRPSEAFYIWKEFNVRGRILVYIDSEFSIEEIFQKSVEARFAMMGRMVPLLSDDNFIIHAMFNNIIRKIYYIAPDNSWDGIKEILIKNKAISYHKGIFRLTIEGVPLIILRQQDMNRFSEKPLVYINTSSKDGYDPLFLKRFIDDTGISDIVLIKE